MKYKASSLSVLFKNTWNISTETEGLFCRRGSSSFQINYFDIQEVKVEFGKIWDAVKVKTPTDTTRLEGLSGRTAKALSQDLESRVKNTVVTHILGDENLLTQLETHAKALFASGRYICQTDVRKWVCQIPQISRAVAHPYFDPELLSIQAQSQLSLFLKIRENHSIYVKQYNDQFVKDAMESFSSLFGSLEKYPLSLEQMRAAIINEDRNLLIAAAGSGKTSTIVAKAIYLICAGLARPEEILILAYNKDAQTGLEKRLDDLLNIVPEYDSPLKVKTFHSFGYEILSAAGNAKPRVSQFATAGAKRQLHLFAELINELYESDRSFRGAW